MKLQSKLSCLKLRLSRLRESFRFNRMRFSSVMSYSLLISANSLGAGSVFFTTLPVACLIYNCASKLFLIERGVHQACPFLVFLVAFIIATEVLAQNIRNSNEIQGIKIQDKRVVELSQYAVDTTAILANVHSVSNLFAFLFRFERCAELKINLSKSEMLWLDSMKHRKDGVLDLQIKDEPVYALGTYFSNDDEPSDRENFLDKLTKLEKTLNFWPQREISGNGRIDIITTLALLKVIFVCSFIEIPPRFAEE